MKSLELSPDLSGVYVDPEDPEREFYLPEKLDLMVTGACPMRCDGCWGPKHNSIQPEMTPEQWMQIVYYVDRNNRAERFNVSNIASYNATVCITGGEPLLYSGLTGLVNLLSLGRVHTTLSTTGIDPDKVLPDILDGVQELGIPLDGSSPESNSLWRKGKYPDGGFNAAISSLLMAQTDFPDVRLTVRTMLHPGKIDDVVRIPQVLEDSGLDLTAMDWKFYLHNDNSGPRKGHSDLLVKPRILEELGAQLTKLSSKFNRINLLSPQSEQDRMVINHDGSAHIVLPNGEASTADVPLGNIATNPNLVTEILNKDYLDFLARSCGRGAIFRYLSCVEQAAKAHSSDPILSAVNGYKQSIADIKA